MLINGQNITLEDTIELMKSTDRKDNFVAEYLQLLIRYNMLREVLYGNEDAQLKAPREEYVLQLDAMYQYLMKLKYRALYEGINLHEDICRFPAVEHKTEQSNKTNTEVRRTQQEHNETKDIESVQIMFDRDEPLYYSTVTKNVYHVFALTEEKLGYIQTWTKLISRGHTVPHKRKEYSVPHWLFVLMEKGIIETEDGHSYINYENPSSKKLLRVGQLIVYNRKKEDAFIVSFKGEFARTMYKVKFGKTHYARLKCRSNITRAYHRYTGKDKTEGAVPVYPEFIWRALDKGLLHFDDEGNLNNCYSVHGAWLEGTFIVGESTGHNNISVYSTELFKENYDVISE